MPRDDLSIDGAFRNIKNMPQVELQDTAAVLDDFVNRVANLPAEIQFMRDEICDKERGEKACEDVINSRDSSIQKWIKINTALIANPKEDLLRKSARENFDKMKLLQEKKCAYALKSQQAMDRHIKYLDTQIKSLQDRNEFPTDADIPSLLHRSSSSDLILDRVSVAKATVVSGQSTNSTSGHGTPRLPGQQAGIVRAMSMQAQPQHANNSPAPASPAAAALLAGQRARESSVGAVNKRQRLTGGSVPINSSSLARHSSMGPGTPKAGTPSAMRAGSAGPGSRKTIGKKQAPHLKGGARKRKPGKSGLSRVRSGNRNSPSTNDSELSEAESGTADDEDEISTPPAGTKNGDGDADMADGDEDDGTDDKKYCICQSVSFGDMVACDNDKCALEWFHWGCVGLKVEPLGAWLCPLCVKTAGDKKKGKKEESG